MAKIKRILITGAGGAAAANFIKSLRENPAKEKFYLVGTDTNKEFLEIADAEKKYLIPNTNSKNYLSTLNKIIVKEKIDYVHPQPDTEVAFLSKNRGKLKTSLLLSKDKIVALCQDKMKLNEFLYKKNIPVPKAYSVKYINKLLKIHDKLWLRAKKGAGSKASIPITSSPQAKSWIKYWETMKNLKENDFMVNEFLPGNEYAFQSVWENGQLLMSQARKRCQYLFGNLTVSGQSSSPSVAVTVNNEEVNDICFKAVKILDPNATGIFCIDLKTDKNGIIKITEINIGRFFTTSYFFSKAGINMPYYYIKRAFKEALPKSIKKFNNLKEGLYWIRVMDRGHKLIKNNKWTSINLTTKE